MKICFVTKSDYNVIKNIGRIRELPKELNKPGHIITLISAIYSGSKPVIDNIEGLSDVDLLCIGRSSFFMSTLYFLKLNSFFLHHREKLSRTDFFILDYNSVIPLIVFLLLSKLRVIKSCFVLDVRTIPVEVQGIKRILANTEFDIAIKIASILCSGITAITDGVKKDMLRRSLKKNMDIGIWSSGVSLSTFNHNAEPHKFETFLSNGDFTLIHHGVISPNRGLKELVFAMKEVNERNTKIKLLIVGDGPSYTSLKTLVSELKLNGCILFTGLIPYKDIPGYIARCSAGIIPLPDIYWWRISSPQKLLEYLAMGKNVIVSEIDAHRNILDGGCNAKYIKSIDARSIANSILNAFDEWHSNNFSELSVGIIERDYTWNKQSEKIIKFLSKLT